jgi:hypothetical protein
MNNSDNELVTSIWGTMERREMLRLLGSAGIALGVGFSSVGTALGSSFNASPQGQPAQDKINKPLLPEQGLPYREILPYQNSLQKLHEMNPTVFATPENFARPVTKDGMPKVRRTRSASWYDKPGGAYGRAIFQYTNTPTHQRDSCAQAAVATLLTRFNLVPAGLSGDAVTERVYATYPPDVQGDNGGTTSNRLVQAIQGGGMKCWAGGGGTVGDEAITKALKTWVAGGYPCILLLDMTQVTNVPGSQYWGHWAVAFAFDANHVYLTNWDYTTFRNDWTSFYRAWKLPSVYNNRRYWMVIGWV